MKIKHGATLIGLKIQMRKALMLADQVWSENGKELVVTSGTDGAHSAGSLHYYGYALDFRIRYFDANTLEKVIAQLARGLREVDIAYRMIVHSTHIHVEWRGIIHDQLENPSPMLIDKRENHGSATVLSS
jgi:hypothetical protein